MKRSHFLLGVAIALATVYSTTSAYWQPIRGDIPTHTFVAGHENDGTPLYLCRAHYLNSIQIGKTWSGYDKCDISYAGREIPLSDYEINIQDSQGEWQPGPGDDIPVGGFRVGTDTNGNPLFLCRTPFNGGMQPGKTWAGYDKCNFSYGGEELFQRNFEIYVKGNSNSQVNRECVNSSEGRICGYSCASAFGHARCALRPGEECKADAYGEIICGFHCASAFGHVQCGDRPGQNCVADHFGNIKCGYNCHQSEFGEVICDSEN